MSAGYQRGYHTHYSFSGTSLISVVLFWALIIGNVIAAVFGFTYWYGPQLLQTSWQYWIFLASCPFFAVMFIICALMIWFEKKISILFYITAVGLIKYGIWTVVFWLMYTGQPISDLMLYWLVGSHTIMIVEAFILFSRIEFKPWFVVLGWVIFGFYDYINYSLKLVTNKVPVGFNEMYLAIGLTVFVPLIVYWLVKRFRFKNRKVLI
jgi:uncharacterized membrane protein YpjA